MAAACVFAVLPAFADALAAACAVLSLLKACCSKSSAVRAPHAIVLLPMILCRQVVGVSLIERGGLRSLLTSALGGTVPVPSKLLPVGAAGGASPDTTPAAAKPEFSGPIVSGGSRAAKEAASCVTRGADGGFASGTGSPVLGRHAARLADKLAAKSFFFGGLNSSPEGGLLPAMASPRFLNVLMSSWF